MNRRVRMGVFSAAVVLVAGAGWFAGCGGGGGGGGNTVFQGNMAGGQAFLSPRPAVESRFAWVRLGLVGTAWAQTGGVEVCLTGSDTCTVTDGNGSFVLPVDGDLLNPVCLTFTSPGFSANLCLPFDVPNGTVVTIRNVSCSPSSGACQAEDVDVEEASPSDASEEVSDEDFPSDPSPSVDDPSPSDDEDVSPDDDVSPSDD